MLEKMKNAESSLVFVSFMTGIAALIFSLIMLSIGRTGINLESEAKNILDLSSPEFTVVVLMVLLGFFIHGIRYLGFDYYRKLYNINKKKRGGKRTLLSRFIYYAFRNGTTIEEVLKEKRNATSDESGDADVYDWIRNSQKPERDIWLNANKINNEQHGANIYRFYYYSEIFQCFDTLFLLMVILSLFCALYFITVHSWNIRQQVSFALYAIGMFIFHRISKATSKAFDRRFFLEIEIALKYKQNNEIN